MEMDQFLDQLACMQAVEELGGALTTRVPRQMNFGMHQNMAVSEKQCLKQRKEKRKKEILQAAETECWS